jgi:hypothetical protein
MCLIVSVLRNFVQALLYNCYATANNVCKLVYCTVYRLLENALLTKMHYWISSNM